MWSQMVAVPVQMSWYAIWHWWWSRLRTLMRRARWSGVLVLLLPHVWRVWVGQ